MANEVEIVLTFRDEATGKINKVSGTINKFSDNTKKATKEVTSSWEQSAKSLIALGNVAQSVDNIFSSYQNMQLRLENAQERVNGATDRLADAQRKLNDVMSAGNRDSITLSKAQLNLDKAQADLNRMVADGITGGWAYREAQIKVQEAQADLSDAQGLGKKRADELTAAQQAVENASRSLTIAQNNQQRANNAVVGTYISIGVQSLTLLASLPTLWGVIAKGAIAAWTFVPSLYGIASGCLAITVAGLPLWLIILAIIAAVVAAIAIFMYWKDILMFLLKVMLDVSAWMMITWQKFKDFWEVLWAVCKNIVFSVWNAIVGFIEKSINWVIDKMNFVISALNRIPGVKIPLIPKVDMSAFKAELVDIDKLMAEQEAKRIQLKKDLDIAKGIILETVANKIGYETAKQEPKTEINITGNNYGTDPKQMADAMTDNLKKKINLF